MNVDFPTFEREAEFIELMRKLWRGERELNHQSALGNYPALQLAHYVNEDIPVLYVGFGPNSLHQAGKVYDGAHLHTFMSDQALNEAVTHFRAGEREGRSGGKLWSVFATACDVSEERYLKLIVGRLATLSANTRLWRSTSKRQRLGHGNTARLSARPDCGQHGWRHRQRRQLHRARGNRAADSRTLATCRGRRPQNLCSTLAGSIHRRR